MPSEQDKQIEKLVRAYAEKRRRDAGASFEMPPAMRRTLQAQVARQHPTGAGESPSFLQLLLNSWPRLVFAASMVVVLGVVIWFSNSTPSHLEDLAQNVKKPAEDVFAQLHEPGRDSPAVPEAVGKMQTPGLTVAGPSDEIAVATPPANSPAGSLSSALGVDQRSDLPRRSESLVQLKVAPMAGRGFGGIADGEGVRQSTSKTAEAKQTADFGFANTNSPPRGEGAAGLAQRTDVYGLGFGPTNPSRLALNLPVGPVKDGLLSPALSSRGGEGDDRGRKSTPLFDSLAVGNPGPPTPERRGLNETEVQLGRADNSRPLISRDVTLALAPPKPGSNRNLDLSKATPSPVGAEPEMDGLAKKSSRGNRMYFSQSSKPLQAGRAPSQAGSVLLNSFELEQNGDQIRIYDADGSIYDGQVGSTNETTTRLGGLSYLAEKAKREVLSEGTQLPRNGVQVNGVKEASQKSFFEARGTNRSLNQLVVITGGLISEVEATAEAEALRRPEKESFAPPAPAAPLSPVPPATRFRAIAPSRSAGSSTLALPPLSQPAQNQPTTVLRIVGRAKVGPTNEIEINAIRAPR